MRVPSIAGRLVNPVLQGVLIDVFNFSLCIMNAIFVITNDNINNGVFSQFVTLQNGGDCLAR
jgi:hypothetical protein